MSTQVVAVSVAPPPALPPGRAQRPIEDPLLAYLGSLSPRSRVTVQERLRAVARMMEVPYEQVEWYQLRAHHVEWIRQALSGRGVAPSTVNVTLSALKGIARRARNLNLMSSDEYDQIRDVRGAKGEREPAGRSATAGEIEALVRALGTPMIRRGASAPWPCWRSRSTSTTWKRRSRGCWTGG